MTHDSSKRRLPPGLRALVVASPRTSGKVARRLASLGAEVITFPAIEIRAVEEMEPLDRAIDQLQDYDWVIFTSGYGVDYFLRRWKERAVPLELWKGRNVCAIGPATRRALEDAGVSVALVPQEFVAEAVVQALANWHGGISRLAGKKILIPRAKEARDLIPRGLRAFGASVDIVPCYENVVPEVDPGLIASTVKTPPDLLVFTSPSAVSNFLTLLEESSARALMRKSVVAVLGPITRSALAELGETAHIMPAENTVESLIQTITSFFEARRKVT